MEFLSELIIMILVVVVVFIIAYFLVINGTKHISRYTDFYTDRYFDIKHKPLLDKLIENGSSEKEAYQIIIANQDKELLNKRLIFVFYFILTLVGFAAIMFLPITLPSLYW